MSRESIIQQLKTFPISFYAKRQLTANICEDRCSSYDPFKDEVNVSITQIEDALKNASAEDIEKFARTNFYHEVSHAMLTPKDIRIPFGDRFDILNIVEDERIETINRSLFYGVNFREFVIAMNGNLFNEQAKDADSAFYKLVRFHQGTLEQLQMLEELLRSSLLINRMNDRWDTLDYSYGIEELYSKVYEDFNAQKATNSPNKEKQSSSFDESSETDAHSDSGEAQQNDASNDGSSVASQGSNEARGNDVESKKDETIEFVIDQLLIEQAQAPMKMHEYADENLKQALKEILMSHKSMQARAGSAINGYSGVIDPRLADREDCRFFVQKSRAGHLKQFSKLHLTFYQDVSGSYCNDEGLTNKLFYALTALERECNDFEFDVVTVSDGNHVLPRSKRCIKASGSTFLDGNIFNVVKKQHKPGCINKGIVLFDGECSNSRNFKAFNSKDFSIIYESGNRNDFVRHCPNAKHHYVSGNFAESLINEALSAIRESLR